MLHTTSSRAFEISVSVKPNSARKSKRRFEQMSSTPKSDIESTRRSFLRSAAAYVLSDWAAWLLVIFSLLALLGLVMGASVLAKSRTPAAFCKDTCKNGKPGQSGTDGTIGTNNTTPGENATLTVANTTGVPFNASADVVDVGTPANALLEFFIPLPDPTIVHGEFNSDGGQIAIDVEYTTFSNIVINTSGTYFVIWEGSVLINGSANNSAFNGTIILIDLFDGVLEGGNATRYVGNQSPSVPPYTQTKTVMITSIYKPSTIPTTLGVQWQAAGAGSPPNPQMTMQNNSLTFVRIAN